MVRRFLPLIILALGVGGFLLLKLSRPEPVAVEAQERAWLVDTKIIEPQTHTPILPLYGQLVAPEQIRLTSPLSGRIGERPVHEGQAVGKGELLIALDSADVQPQLDRARADVTDLEAQIESENIRFANDKQALASEKAILDSARRKYERTQSLVNRNLTSQENLDAASDALSRARLTVTSRQRAIDEHPARLKSLNARLQRAKAALATTELDAERAVIEAPFDGVVTDIQVAPGDRVNQNAPLLSIYPNTGLELRATVPDRYRAELLSALSSGQTLEAVTEDGRHRFVLDRFAGTSAPSGTEAILSLRSQAGGEDHGLRPGGLLPVSLQRPSVPSSVAVPYSALYGSNSVYLMSEDRRMQRVQVERQGEVPVQNGERHVLVASDDLAAGRALITTHLPNAMSGLKVQVAGNGDSKDSSAGAEE
ncbi:HlyD family efflux transporter periplasmic adaptor subunit [Marinobacter sp. CHS3-4]|uniref:efflux RND transporter periplasmic adaptor subunit n=1 Tax=Marinobacter sp. CHS3-4 TaxID=3045174 RepID=UPI0024B49F0B|nr:HlyD family efflux transporter periplasmic adaptor subunit [Marinobacter sp. CHS3-4]MDI9246305.1 HlyD family efflux transporter periplasmic adaptor subunit [Marinobacter sp. CHS3-4]